jgi:RNA polymerase sigma-70 factor (ECF subfamily)
MLPSNSREILILRELEGMSYKEIADITGMPIGTVMSSLSRARGRLRQILATLMDRGPMPSSRRIVEVNAGVPGSRRKNVEENRESRSVSFLS